MGFFEYFWLKTVSETQKGTIMKNWFNGPLKKHQNIWYTSITQTNPLNLEALGSDTALYRKHLFLNFEF